MEVDHSGMPRAAEAMNLAAPGDGDPDTGFPAHARRLLVTLSPYAVAALIALAAALWTYQPWLFGSAVQLPTGDGASFHHHIQNTIDTGWYETGSRLAAPFSQNGHAYPNTDELTFLLIGNVLATGLGSAGAAVTWWVILGFPASAIIVVGIARYLGISRVVSVIPGVAFALVPDHFLRPAIGHVLLASIWAMALGMLAAFTLLGPRPASPRNRLWAEVGMVGACVVVAVTVNYYAVFTGLLVAVAGVGGALARREPGILARAAARGFALVVPIVLALYVDAMRSPEPTGYGPLEPTRFPAGSEIYGGKLVAAFLPTPWHRLEVFRTIRGTYDRDFPNPAEYPSLGLAAAIGLSGLLLWSIVRLWSLRSPGLMAQRLGLLAGFTWVSLLIFSVGAVGSAWALVLGEGIRVWSRAHVILVLLGVLALALALDRIPLRAWRTGATVAVIVVVVFDQTSPLWRPDPGRATAVQKEVEALTSQIAAQTDTAAMIYQVPQRDFPAPQDVTAIYDSFLPYLYSDDLRWSYGGFQGDPTADWQAEMSRLPFSEQAPLLAAAGFAGVLVDNAALPDPTAFLQEVTSTLGAPTVTSSSGRWLFFPLTQPDCSDSVLSELSDAATRLPIVYPGVGFEIERDRTWTAVDPEASLKVITLRDGGWDDATLAITFRSPPAGLVITWPDGTLSTAAEGESILTWSGKIASGQTDISVERRATTGSYSVIDSTVDVQLSGVSDTCLKAANQAA